MTSRENVVTALIERNILPLSKVHHDGLDYVRTTHAIAAADAGAKAVVEECDSVLRTALEEIVNPIKFMRERLKPDEVLNGLMAVRLSESASYLQEIAKRALARAAKGGSK